MAVKRMTLEEALASITDADREQLRKAMAETTEEEIRRHMIEDGEDPDAPLPPFAKPPDAKAIRAKLGMTQAAFADLLGIPVPPCAIGNSTASSWIRRRDPC